MARSAKILITAEDRTRAALESASGGFGKLQAHAQGMSAGMGLAMAGAGAALAAFAKSSVDKYEQVGSETIKLSRLTGGTAEDMSALRVQAQMSGVPFDNLTKSITIFAKGLEAGKPAKAMEDLGIAVHDATGHTRPFGEMLGQISDKFHDMPNGLDKTRLATELFGRSGADLEPLLNKGSGALSEITEKARSLGLVLDEKATVAMKEHIAKQREMGLAMDGLKMSIGEGLMPVMEGITTVLTGVTEGFAKLPGPIKDIAVYGTGAAAGIMLISSAMRFVGGQVGNVKNGLLSLKGALVDAEGGLTKIGVAAKVTGGVIAAAGISEAIFGAINSVENRAGQSVDALNELKIALANAGGAAEDTAVKFLGVVRVEDETQKMSHLWSDFGTDIVLTFSGVKKSLEDTQSGFDKLRSTDPAGAQKVLESLQQVTDTLPKNSGQWQANTDFIEKNSKSLGLAATATDIGTTATDNATKSLKDYADQLKANSDPLFAMIDSNQKLSDAQLKVFAAQSDVNTALREHGAKSPEYAAATRSLADANDTATRSAFDWDTAQASLAQKLRDNPGMIQDVRAELGRLVESHKITADQAWITAVKIGLVGENARAASGTYDLIFNARTNGFTGVNGVIGQIQAAMRSGNGVPLPGRAVGGPVSSGSPYMVGERGPEVFVPSSSGTIIPNGATTTTAAGNTYNINLSGMVGDKASLGAYLIDTISDHERRNGSSWRAA